MISFLIINNASAETIKSARCKNNIIKLGDDIKRVKKYCGKAKYYKNRGYYYRTHGTPKRFYSRNGEIYKIVELR